jgi:hypothetical protein
MSNTAFKPNHGDVYRTTDTSIHDGMYRMYIKVPGNDTLLCVKLNDGESYVHSVDNGLVDPTCEEFVFNMCDLVEKE